MPREMILRQDATTGKLVPVAESDEEADGLAIDDAGTVYMVTNQPYGAVYRVDAMRKRVSLVAGAASEHGGDGGPARTAQLAAGALAVDAHGNLFLASGYGNRVREVHADTGIITTVAGTGVPGARGDGGPATKAELDDPEGLAVDRQGNLYIADTGNNRVRKVDLHSGVITSIVTPARLAGLSRPSGVAVDDAGDLFILHEMTRRADGVRFDAITKIDGRTGHLTALLRDVQESTTISLSSLSVDGAGDVFYLVGAQDQTGKWDWRIRRIAAHGGAASTVAGGGTDTHDGIPAPQARIVTPGGEGGASEYPVTTALDSQGDLFISDGQHIRKVAAHTGIITTIAGNGTRGPSGDGGAPRRAGMIPQALTLDRAGNLYVIDGDSRVRKITQVG